ncbi:hypothetical protein Nocox_00330 [Nonomuraea coxensis DSM 45129]|uniref:DUF1700 domain-containing protein n=1 Tax=Nonomuraea coxensis DSM 45129 TaxID=1122611 RepID=A0ABX8TQD4_9ACTN|nr:hypothetical protein [Nonomuraea coxensis]QYC37705.1 hypothetical protein Nocox_00330 [Nonomuraea coxensis DSM 45129]
MTKDLRHNTIAEEYLAEIERAAAALPVNRRAELLADVRSHIAVARAEAASGSPDGVEDDAAMSRILSHLGDPDAIAAAAIADLPAETSANATARADSRLLEKIAVILLLVGGFLFGIGWLIGLILMWSSRRWSFGDKLLGTLLVPGGLALPVLMLTAGSQTCVGAATQGGGQAVMECSGLDPTLSVLLAAVLALASVFTVIRLVLRAHRT